MKKLLGFLGTITIAGSGVAGLVGNAPALAKNNIDYQQTNNLKNLNRSKRDLSSTAKCVGKAWVDGVKESAIGAVVGGAGGAVVVGSVVPGAGTAAGAFGGALTGSLAGGVQGFRESVKDC